MNSAIFSTASESYQVSNINYASAVSEIPADKRTGENTHSFRMITSLSSVFCHFKNDESAKKARIALTMMMERCKSSVYKHGFDLIDTQKIVSFSRVLPLKNSQNGHTHAIVVTVECAEGKNNQVWLRYRSEENAQKGIKALWANIHAANRQVSSATEEKTEGETAKEEATLVA